MKILLSVFMCAYVCVREREGGERDELSRLKTFISEYILLHSKKKLNINILSEKNFSKKNSIPQDIHSAFHMSFALFDLCLFALKFP